jgi:uncharacterized damage-inducible protein DinB
MAIYNQWQNRNIIEAANQLSEAERQADRGAFFKSIAGTLNHLLWGDTIWLHRLAGAQLPNSTTPT